MRVKERSASVRPEQPEAFSAPNRNQIPSNMRSHSIPPQEPGEEVLDLECLTAARRHLFRGRFFIKAAFITLLWKQSGVWIAPQSVCFTYFIHSTTCLQSLEWSRGACNP